MSVAPNGGGIKLNQDVTIGNGATSDATLRLLQLDNYNTGDDGSEMCGQGNNQGAIYYNKSNGKHPWLRRQQLGRYIQS